MASAGDRFRRRDDRMRRIVVALAISLCATIPAVAQDAAPLPLVGVLNINTAANDEPTAAMLRDARNRLRSRVSLGYQRAPRRVLTGGPKRGNSLNS